MVVGYGYLMETFTAWYGKNPYETYQMLQERPWGQYAHTWWMMIACNVGTAQLFWIPAVRRNPALLWFLSIFVNIGMWLERYVIVVVSLHKDFLPSAWGVYHGTFWDYATYYGTLGLFLALMFLFIRFLPVISIAEMRELVHETQEEGQTTDTTVAPQGIAP
jgi:molybdopterin-containing oxidoreductase family membrane subunit